MNSNVRTGLLVCLGVAVTLVTLPHSRPAAAQTPVTDPLAVAAWEAKSQYEPIRPDQLDAARTRLLQSTQRLESFLGQGTPENAQQWKTFLKWDSMDRQLRSTSPRLGELAKTYQRFRSGEEGLNLPAFRNVRDDLRGYLERMQLFDVAPGRLDDARLQLQTAIEGLQGFLDTAPQREGNWKRFLRWDELEGLLEEDSRDLRSYSRVLNRFQGDEPGLELPPFRHVGNRLGKYMEVMAANNRGVTDTDLVTARLEKLANDLQHYADEPNAITTAAVRGDLQWLESTGQMPRLAHRIRARFSQPNVQFLIQSDLVARAMSDTASQTNPVAMCFYGSWVTGTSRSNVSFRGHLIPSPDVAVIDIRVGGQARTVSVARKRKVKVYTTSDTELAATKRLMFDGYRLIAEPAMAFACTDQRICGIDIDRRCGQRLIGRLARRQAVKLRPCAEELANCKGRRRLTEGMDRQAGEMIAKTNQQLADLRHRLREQGAFPEHLDVQSTPQDIRMRATLQSAGILTAPSAAPAMNLDNDVVVQLHESAVNNLLAGRIAGMKLDSDRIADRMKELNIEPESKSGQDGGELQNEDEAGEDEPWSMQFDQVSPVAVVFDDGKVAITVRGTNFTRGGQKINNTIDIKAVYEFVYSRANGLGVRRVGDVEISFVGTEGRLSTRQITYKTFLARKVSALFRQRLALEDIPAGDLKDQLDRLPPNAIYARNGWMTIGTDIGDSVLKEAMGS
jgi:hypothetical protein